MHAGMIISFLFPLILSTCILAPVFLICLGAHILSLPRSSTHMSTLKNTKSSVQPGQPEATNAHSSGSDHSTGHHFTIASVAALHSSSFAPGYSNSERQAAARALLRHDSHLDGTHYHTRTPAGLHPSYIAFNKALASPDKRMITHEEFVEAALQDIFDAVSLISYFSLYGFSRTYPRFACKTV